MSVRGNLFYVVLIAAGLLVSNITFAADKDVNVVNTPEVNVANAPDVNVTNDETSPVPVSAQTIVEWRYVGLTAFIDDGRIEFGGRVGVAAMHNVCASEFGPAARASSISEAYHRDDADTRVGWVAPGGPILTAFREQRSSFTAHDAATGLTLGTEYDDEFTALVRAYCARFAVANIGDFGTVVMQDGLIRHANCTLFHAVSCSAPVAIPAAP